MEEGKTEIQVKNLSKSFGKKQALKNVTLTIGQGMFGLLGPNGAGKTTLMRVITTLLQKDTGEVSVCGIPVEECRKVRGLIGYLPQDFSMYGNMTAYEALDYLAVLSGLRKQERKERIPEMLKTVNLWEYKRTKVKAMSGGMRRRLGIAQALIHDPKVLVVDEPTAGLDPEERVRFRNLLCETAKDRVVLLSTHIVGDIEATCEKIAILNQGSCLYQGTVLGLLSLVEGKVYTVEVAATELESVKERFLVSGILTAGASANVKIVADERPIAGAKPCPAGTEDAYLYLMHHPEYAGGFPGALAGSH